MQFRYWIDEKFREKQIKKAWKRRQDKAAGRKPVTSEDPIHNLYLWMDMDKWRETNDFRKSVCYYGRTVQRDGNSTQNGKKGEESYKDRINKVEWIDKVMSGEKDESCTSVFYCVAGSDVRLPPRGTSWISCKG
ncbi:hypothetical protein WR25_00049 [Diploscapter pachys]|uniref:Uncharacterized protein n=1 Tax=Diploscapter pachys TaxID=2018661 RepID=A0A2A2KDX4_9BILA|nr:hypothetical protein WR25_00049 [Diploscapter pachys]